jgi:succinate dehydrogenase / fumarate reductase iron-sulfur subunit
MGFRVIKDMVVDMEGFFAQYRSVLPFLVTDAQVPADGRERRQSVDDRERFDGTTKHRVRGVHHQLPQLLGG